MRPTHILHADWGTAPSKRWLAQASLGTDGRYTARTPNRIENHADLIPSISRQLGRKNCAVVGFDFPIGIPVSYARLAGVTDFKRFLLGLGDEPWVDFYKVARTPPEISIQRPFYPLAPGKSRHTHLLNALGLDRIDDLRRECEKQRAGRRAACPLFWTLGANQVGKGAIVGWRDVLTPALRNEETVSIWPFDGRLFELLRPGEIVVVETYPAECYGWLFDVSLKSKRKRENRQDVSACLLKRAQSLDLKLDAELVRAIEEGFPEGDDPFDSVVGLLGMLEVINGRRQSGEPNEDRISRLEGWILGQVPSHATCASSALGDDRRGRGTGGKAKTDGGIPE